MPADDFFYRDSPSSYDWRAKNETQTLISTIKTDFAYREHIKTYVELCDKSNPSGTTDWALMQNRSIVAHKIFPDNGCSNTVLWAQTRHWQEFELDGCYLEEGSDAIYSILTVGVPLFSPEILPRTNSHTQMARILGYEYDAKPSCFTSGVCTLWHGARYSFGQETTEETTAHGSVTEEVSEEDEVRQEKISKARRDVQLLCGRYALEILSSASFWTHSIIMFKAVDIFEPDAKSQDTDGTDTFAALLAGLCWVALKQWGIQEEFHDNRVLKGCMDAADPAIQGHLYCGEAQVG
ncbi:uncharacterized protein ARMOST_14563 [Armillaria ostoyae]|uniref:Uncharacterized protein n=1 Tax=Armillaria ostoyae TaxID=47428 RepID=A0A284RQY9_ARMOS|nr:uncharacterized protein ARMOST_14563 [Armillaria ostoyae]